MQRLYNVKFKRGKMKLVISCGLFSLFSILFILYLVNLTENIYANKTQNISLIANTINGKVKGFLDKSRNSKSFISYLGIKYANVEKRFQESVEVNETWVGVKDAFTFGSNCLEIGPNEIGDEDCLFLNIYTHTNFPRKNKKYPIIFYIHGGSFSFDSGDSYGPKYFMDEGVILITVNYRLGAFGFLNVGTNNANGNMGLKDLILALKWIQKNIHNFGGDSNKVTIFGSSAGAAAVSILILSPLAQGLFSAGISSSGSFLSPWAFTNDPISPAKQLAVSLDCPTSNLDYMIDCLRKIDAKVLAIHCGSIELGIGKNPPPYFLPSIDKNIIPEHPTKMFNLINNSVPWIIGINSNEGISTGALHFVTTNSSLHQLNEQSSRVLSRALILNEEDTCKQLTDIKKKYFNNSKIESENDEHLQSLAKLFTDQYFFHGARESARKYRGNVYFYILKYAGQYSTVSTEEDQINERDKKIHKWSGASHGDELLYLFSDLPSSKNKVPNDEFIKLSKKIVQIFVEFASTRSLEIDNDDEWVKVLNEKSLNYLSITSPSEIFMTFDEYVFK